PIRQANGDIGDVIASEGEHSTLSDIFDRHGAAQWMNLHDISSQSACDAFELRSAFMLEKLNDPDAGDQIHSASHGNLARRSCTDRAIPRIGRASPNASTRSP